MRLAASATGLTPGAQVVIPVFGAAAGVGDAIAPEPGQHGRLGSAGAIRDPDQAVTGIGNHGRNLRFLEIGRGSQTGSVVVHPRALALRNDPAVTRRSPDHEIDELPARVVFSDV